MAIGKKNKIKLNPLDYNIMFSGPSKIGKTTLVREVCEKLVGRDGYLFCETGTERGADAIEGINYVDAIDWNSDYDEEANTVGFSVLIDDIVNNKTSDYADLKVKIYEGTKHVGYRQLGTSDFEAASNNISLLVNTLTEGIMKFKSFVLSAQGLTIHIQIFYHLITAKSTV